VKYSLVVESISHRCKMTASSSMLKTPPIWLKALVAFFGAWLAGMIPGAITMALFLAAILLTRDPTLRQHFPTGLVASEFVLSAASIAAVAFIPKDYPLVRWGISGFACAALVIGCISVFVLAGENL